jgi:hypothetical protein
MLRKSFAICTLALALVVAIESASQAAVSSWLSTVGTVGGGFTKSNATLDIQAGQSGSLYLWLENTTQLRSVAYDLTSGTAGKINLTGVEVYTPDLLAGGTPIGQRWNLPVAAGTVAGDGQSITNFGAVNVDKAGLTVATRTFDALWDATASAALVAKINFNAVAAGSTVLSMTEGLTKIVEAGNPNTPTLTFGTATINVLGDTTVDVGTLALTQNTLGQTVSGVVSPLTGVTTLALNAANAPIFTPLLPGKPLTLPNLPTIDNAGNFSWNTTGALRGTYEWAITGTGAGGATDGGTVSVTVTQVPEPATLALVGLVAVGCVSIARRRS